MLKEIYEYKNFTLSKSVLNGELIIVFELTEPKSIQSIFGRTLEKTATLTEDQLIKRLEDLKNSNQECLVSNRAFDVLLTKKRKLKPISWSF